MPGLSRPSTSFFVRDRLEARTPAKKRGVLAKIELRRANAVMAGLVPAIHVLLNARMKGGWVYFMTNRRNGILYVGVTSNLPRRAYEHREGLVGGFSKRYSLKMLVYCENYDDIRTAIQRERAIKHWPRAWKVRLIHAQNPEWEDLYDTLI